jgi:hypothetical protein
LTGGCSRSASTPAARRPAAAFAATWCQWRSRSERRVVERALAEHRRVAGCGQKHVALAQRHVEPLGEMQNHVAARLRPPGFEKRQMPGRDVGFECQIELAQPPARAPFAQMLADATQLLSHLGRIAPSR